MSGQAEEKEGASKTHLEVEVGADAVSHSYEQVGHGATSTQARPAPSQADSKESQKPDSNTRHSQQYDPVEFEDAPLDASKDDYVVPSSIPVNDQNAKSADSSGYKVPSSLPRNPQYMALGNVNLTSEYYKVPVNRKKQLFQKKSESQSQIVEDDEEEEPDYENKEEFVKKKRNVGSVNCARVVLLAVAIGVAALALVLSFIGIGVASSKSCDCPTLDFSRVKTLYNCSTTTLSTCSLAQATSADAPSCVTPSRDLSPSSQVYCSVNPGTEQRPITAALLYGDITGASSSAQCQCSVVLPGSNETQLVPAGVECVLKATECRVSFRES